MKDIIKGIDISTYQANLDFKKTKSAGVEFCFVKITEGIFRAESKIKISLNQAINAKKEGIKIGYYHFATDVDVFKQANYVKQTLANYPFPKADFPVILDLEDTEYSKLPKGADFESFVNKFHSELSSNPNYRELILYSYVPYLNSHLPKNHGLAKYPLWIAGYPFEAQKLIDFSTIDMKKMPNVPNGWQKYIGWQFTGNGTLPFYKGNIDLNVMDKDFFNKY